METAIKEIVKIIVKNYRKLVKCELEIAELREKNYFGACSVCGSSDGYFIIGRNHFYICHKHKKRWNVGSNLFSTWRNENEKIWKKNWKKIFKYDEITGDEWRSKKIEKIEKKYQVKELNELPDILPF